MFIETKEIGPEGLLVERTVDAFQLPLGEGEVVQIDAVRLTGELRREQDGVSFTGELATVARLPCSRCLDTYPLALDLHFDLAYTTRPETFEKGESRVDEDRITVNQFDGQRIDLGQVLTEQVYLGLPLKPLCSAECHGLCPRCGTNLNQDACNCQEERAEDPRLLVLKKLL